MRFCYEWHDDAGAWFRAYGNENWHFDSKGLMVKRFASINDLPIAPSERKLLWASATRPSDFPDLDDLWFYLTDVTFSSHLVHMELTTIARGKSV